MSYRKGSKKQYDMPRHKPNQLPFQQPLKKKTEWIFDLFQKTPTVTKKEETTPIPDVIEKKNNTNVSIGAGNQAGKMIISGAKESTERMNFTSQHSKKSKRTKAKGTNVV